MYDKTFVPVKNQTDRSFPQEILENLEYLQRYFSFLVITGRLVISLYLFASSHFYYVPLRNSRQFRWEIKSYSPFRLKHFQIVHTLPIPLCLLEKLHCSIRRQIFTGFSHKWKAVLVTCVFPRFVLVTCICSVFSLVHLLFACLVIGQCNSFGVGFLALK